MSDPIERDGNYGVLHPHWTAALTETDRPVSSWLVKSIWVGIGLKGIYWLDLYLLVLLP